MVSKTTWLGVGAALTTVTVWAGFILLSRFGLSTNIAIMDMAVLRFTVAGVVMLPFLLYMGLRGVPFFKVACLSATGGVMFALIAYNGFARAPAAHGAILMPGTLPLYTTLLAVIFLKERPSPLKWLALLCVLGGILALGIAVIVWGDAGVSTGHAFFLTGSFTWAVFTILLRRWQVDALHATAIVTVFSAVLFMPYYLIFVDSQLLSHSWQTLAVQGVYQGVIAVVVGLFAFSTAVKLLGPTSTTLLTALTPAVVAVGAALLLNEAMTLVVIIGVVAVIAGGMLSALATPSK